MPNDEGGMNDEALMANVRLPDRLFLCFVPSWLRHWTFVLRHSHHLSHSPITKSRLPSTAGTSLTRQPGKSSGRILRLTNDGARIFNRYGTPPPLLLM